MRSLFDDEDEGSAPSQAASWEQARDQALACTSCRLHESRTQVVFGEGAVPSELMFVGEAPGEVEDEQGRPFVGPAGQLLDDILASVGFDRSTVYITNVVKSRPPNNRAPQRDEIETCWPHLEAEIRFVEPHIIVTLGNSPTRCFLGSRAGITKVRGQFFDWRDGIRIFPMFHPSFLLRNPSKEPGSPKHLTWQDIQTVKAALDEPRAS